jgi:hypothetical protein
MSLFLIGAGLLSAILGLFWLMDRLESPLLGQIAYSGLIARLAVVGAACSVLGILVMLAELAERWSA